MTSSTDMATDLIRVLDDLGPALVGREAGARFREHLIVRAAAAPVVVDLAGVESVSPSFADELFATLPDRLITERRVRFANASEEITSLARGVRGLRRQLTTV